jgi:hypothetical protein
MTTTASDSEVVAAEAEAETADQLANSLEEAIRSGDTTITPDELTKQRSLVGFLRLQVDGARAKAETRRTESRARALVELHDEIVSEATESGAALTKALETVEIAARAFLALSAQHDDKVMAWSATLDHLNVPKGTHEEGVGRNGIGEVQANGFTLSLVHGPRYLNLIFDQVEGGSGNLNLTGAPWRRDAAFKELGSIGKAN